MIAVSSDRRLYKILKRTLDILIAAMGVVVLSPVMGIIVLAVAMTSSGPILFRQKRVGFQGKDFEFLKFRTMTCLEGAEEGLFTPGDQCRVTKVGRFLRSTKLDELPQFFNVLRGEMSLVGPRPEVREWVDAYPERWALIHTVKPGIFDPAVAVFRDEEVLLAESTNPAQTYRDVVLPAKLMLNEGYIVIRGPREDARVLFRGVLSVFLAAKSLEKFQRNLGRGIMPSSLSSKEQ